MLPDRRQVEWERTASGVSTPVFRIEYGREVLFLRLAETPSADLAPEVASHGRLRDLGVKVPEVIHYESFAADVGRSVALTRAIDGSAVADGPLGSWAPDVAREAGRDLAVINTVDVDGFGFVRRDGSDWPLRGEHDTYASFVADGVVPDVEVLADLVLDRAAIDSIHRLVERAANYSPRSLLAHGDFDTTAIFHRDGRYTGIIDLGEIRGAAQHYDLAHFAVRESDPVRSQMLEALYAGYREVTSLPEDLDERVLISGILNGTRQLTRWIHRWGPAALDAQPVAALANRVRQRVRSRLDE